MLIFVWLYLYLYQHESIHLEKFRIIPRLIGCLLCFSSQPLKSHVRMYSPLDTNESEWQISQIGLQFLVTHDHFVSGKLKIRCSASIYDIYWQSTEVSAEEDRPRVIHYEPAATIVGINYLQPPPNFQTGQKKPDGQVGVKGKAFPRRSFVISKGAPFVNTSSLYRLFIEIRDLENLDRVPAGFICLESVLFFSSSNNIRRGSTSSLNSL